MNRKWIRRVILLAFAALVVLLIVVQILNQFSSGIRTETATRATVMDSVRLEGLIIRKEALVENDSSGVISYEISSGTKVAAGGVVAAVYSDADAAAAESKRVELEQQLKQLKGLDSSAQTSTANPDNVNKQIYQKLYSLRTNVSDFNLSDITKNRDDILNLLNQWQLATGKIEGFSQRISQLQAEIDALGSGTATGAITAKSSGYFVEAVDGYENVYDYDKAKYLTVEELQETPQAEEVDDRVIGKVCEQFHWYVACIVPAETAAKLKVGETISFKLPFASSTNLPGEVVGVNQEDKESEAAVILSCSYMDETLANIRKETVLLNIGSYEGIRVSQEALHFRQMEVEVTDADGKTQKETREVRGVYVVDGSEMRFVQIIPLYSSENYVICDPNPEEGVLATDKTITLYDTVILGGEELYDGKPIN